MTFVDVLSHDMFSFLSVFLHQYGVEFLYTMY